LLEADLEVADQGQAKNQLTYSGSLAPLPSELLKEVKEYLDSSSAISFMCSYKNVMLIAGGPKELDRLALTLRHTIVPVWPEDPRVTP